MGLSIIMTENHANELRAELSRAKKAALAAVGVRAQADVAPRAPIDTGRLQNSINWRLQGDSAVAIGTNVEYAIYQEFGTSKIDPHPYLRPGITENTDAYRDIIKSYLEGKA